MDMPREIPPDPAPGVMIPEEVVIPEEEVVDSAPVLTMVMTPAVLERGAEPEEVDSADCEDRYILELALFDDGSENIVISLPDSMLDEEHDGRGQATTYDSSSIGMHAGRFCCNGGDPQISGDLQIGSITHLGQATNGKLEESISKRI